MDIDALQHTLCIIIKQKGAGNSLAHSSRIHSLGGLWSFVPVGLWEVCTLHSVDMENPPVFVV
jgi:hypothetical protein